MTLERVRGTRLRGRSAVVAGERGPTRTRAVASGAMETWDALTARRNVRSYTDRPIPPPTSTASSRRDGAAPPRPTARSGTSSWSPTASSSQELGTVWQGARHVAGSAATIVLVLPEPEAERYRVIDQYDLGQATMVMMLAATDLGIGSGHSAVGDQDAGRRILGRARGPPRAYMLALGYPADRPLAPIRAPDRAAVRRRGPPRPLVGDGPPRAPQPPSRYSSPKRHSVMRTRRGEAAMSANFATSARMTSWSSGPPKNRSFSSWCDAKAHSAMPS